MAGQYGQSPPSLQSLNRALKLSNELEESEGGRASTVSDLGRRARRSSEPVDVAVSNVGYALATDETERTAASVAAVPGTRERGGAVDSGVEVAKPRARRREREGAGSATVRFAQQLSRRRSNQQQQGEGKRVSRVSVKRPCILAKACHCAA